MRPLTEQETKTLFEKLANYTGASLKNLIAPLDDSPNADRYVFRLQGNRVYYVLLSTANLATSMARDNLLSLGICLGMCIVLIVTGSEFYLPFFLLVFSPPKKVCVFVANSSLSLFFFSQENSQKLASSAYISQPFRSSPNTPAGKFGSRATARCLSCTAATSSRHTLGGGPTTVPNTRASWSTT